MHEANRDEFPNLFDVVLLSRLGSRGYWHLGQDHGVRRAI